MTPWRLKTKTYAVVLLLYAQMKADGHCTWQIFQLRSPTNVHELRNAMEDNQDVVRLAEKKPFAGMMHKVGQYCALRCNVMCPQPLHTATQKSKPSPHGTIAQIPPSPSGCACWRRRCEYCSMSATQIWTEH